MTESTVVLPLFSISRRQEDVFVETLSPQMVPDEQWRYVDARGHGHFWQGDDLPTLHWVVTGTEWVGDEMEGEMVEVGEYRCLQGPEVIQPGKLARYGPTHIPGLVSMTIDFGGEMFTLTEDQYAESVLLWRTQIKRMLGL